MSPTLPDWLWFTAAGLLAAAALALLDWGLRRDPHRSRPRCPKCWYDMAGSLTPTTTTPPRCPECGYQAPSLKKLHCRRRRPRLVAIGLLLALLATAAGFTPKARRDGWRSLIPSPVLVLLLPTGEEALQVQISSMVSSSGGPASLVGEFHRRVVHGEIPSWEITYLLSRMPIVSTRAAWPVGTPLYGVVRWPIWLPFPDTAAVMVEGAPPPKPVSAREMTVVGAPLPASGAVSVQFSGYAWKIAPSGRAVHQSQGPIAWTATASFPIAKRAASMDEVMRPDTSSDVQGAVQSNLDVSISPPTAYMVVGDGLEEPPDTRSIKAFSTLSVWVFNPAVDNPDFPALGMRVEFLRDGNVVASEPIEPDPDNTRRRYDLHVPPAMSDAVKDPALRSHWSVRITGDPELSLRHFAKSTYWPGSITYDLPDNPAEDLHLIAR